MNTNEFFQSHAFSRLVIVLGVLIVLLLIFWVGTLVGYREGEFSAEWNANYMGQFGGPRSPFVSASDKDDAFESAHGAFGEVVGIRLPEIVIKGSSEAEKTVIIGTSTAVRRFRTFATTSDITVGETVIVIGEPDSQGDIQASLVRIIPSPSNASGTVPVSSPLPATQPQ